MRLCLRAAVPALVSVSLSACGDPAVNSGFEGRPLATLQGVVCGGEVKTTPRIPLVGVLWKKDIEKLAKPGSDSSPIQVLSPVRFRIDMFEAPPADMLSRYKANDGAVQAEIGFAILFDDVNGDGVFSHAGEPGGDVLLGMAWDRVLLYADDAGATTVTSNDPMAPYMFANAGALKSGFQIAEGICDENGAATSQLSLLEGPASAHIYVLEKPGVIPQDAPAGSCVRYF